MTSERARRFPLELADLVREPRRPEGRPGEARPASSTIVADTRAGAVRAPVVAREPAGQRAVTPRDPATVKPGNVKPANAKPGNVKPAGIKPAHAKPVHAKPATAKSGNSAAPNVALNSAMALTSERVRERMVERLRANGVTDQRVLNAMAVVPRHMFVDPGLATQAYEDAALPIGHHQTISKPSVVARMIELAAAGRPLSSVLEIGTGCGYQAAVLSQVARDVYSIERIKPLYERAKTNLRPLRIPNIRLHYGDGRIGLPAVAPFDAIVIAAAGLDVPHALVEQLAIGGRLVAPVGSQDGQTQVLTLIERTGPAQWRESRLDRVFFVPLKSGVI